MPWKRMNHGIGLKTHWPPQGLGQPCLSELQQQTPTHTTHARMDSVQHFRLWFWKSEVFELFSFMITDNPPPFPPPPQGGLYFNLVGRWGHHALSQRRASLLPATKCPPTQKPILILIPAHSHSTANKCDLLSFSSHYYNKKEKLNSPLPCQVKWNK